MRVRLLHPEFFSDEAFWQKTSDFAKLVFQGLWLMADRDGLLRDNVRMIDGEVLPHDARTCTPALQELEAAGCIRRTNTAAGPVICVLQFRRWQNPHPREKPSRLQGRAEGEPKASLDAANGHAEGKPFTGLGRAVTVSDPVTVSDTDPVIERRRAAPTARAEPPILRPHASPDQEQRRRVAADAGAKRRASAPVGELPPHQRALLEQHGFSGRRGRK